jgi:hypothetical protein
MKRSSLLRVIYALIALAAAAYLCIAALSHGASRHDRDATVSTRTHSAPSSRARADIYSISANLLSGHRLRLGDVISGRVALIVNVASQ